MTPLVSVILCTHNPRLAVLQEVLAALERQDIAEAVGWELIVVENGSVPSLQGKIDFRFGGSSRIVHEATLGLSHARLRGFAEATGEILVFVDDDNVLDHDYLRIAATVMSEDRTLGAVGGKSIGRFEALPPAWMSETGIDLACRDLGPTSLYASWDGLDPSERYYPVCAPIGAGLVIRRSAFATYVSATRQDPAHLSLGRRGRDLAGGEDNDIVMTVLGSGLRVGYLPQLRLEHVIPASRLTGGYLAAYAYSSMRTWIRVLDMHGIRPWEPIAPYSAKLRKLKAYFTQRAWSGTQSYVRWRSSCGQYDGRADIWRAQHNVD